MARKSYESAVRSLREGDRQFAEQGLGPAAYFPMWMGMDRKRWTRASMLMVSFLVDMQIRQFPKAETDYDGWFPCSVRDLQQKCFGAKGLSERTQSRTMKLLEDEGVIKCRAIGPTNTRCVWINFDLLQEKNDEFARHREEGRREYEKRYGHLHR